MTSANKKQDFVFYSKKLTILRLVVVSKPNLARNNDASRKRLIKIIS